MCGFGIATIFQVAIFVIVVLAVIAMLRLVFPSIWTGWGVGPYGGIIQIVVGAVIAILVLLFLWRMAECAGLLGGRVGWIQLPLTVSIT